MAFDTIVFQHELYSYGYRDYYTMLGLGDQFNSEDDNINEQGSYGSKFSPKTCGGDELRAAGGCSPAVPPPPIAPSRPKRRRVKSLKNKEEIESQRMNHIAVERNRRKQMNDYLAVLRSLMPLSYAQRGDQASIVGGAINFVKELEQVLQILEGHKRVKQQTNCNCKSHLLHNFFSFPQYSICESSLNNGIADQQRSDVADIEVSIVESHANIKVLTSKQQKQLLKMVMGFQSMRLTILHLNITSLDHMLLYSFNVKVEDDCQLTTVNEIATAVHEILVIIREEANMSSAKKFPHN